VTVRPIRLIGDPVLRTACEPVTRFDDALARLVAELLDTVQVPGRAGVAANQIGASWAVFAYNVDSKLGYVINPVLAAAAGEQAGPEACLSVPGISATRHRAVHVVVTGTDLRGDPVIVRGDGELARCLQHETGHLHGELYIDRLVGRERAQVMRRLREQIVAPRLPHGSSPAFPDPIASRTRLAAGGYLPCWAGSGCWACCVGRWAAV